ncbi:uncharacterized protein [Misgurnus anguillicaudatus]|uniref:uncharacterized protein n=1 Tax=Misgurnus anguillicaudatus TaxID=75329 RepID=UPI003CCF1931
MAVPELPELSARPKMAVPKFVSLSSMFNMSFTNLAQMVSLITLPLPRFLLPPAPPWVPVLPCSLALPAAPPWCLVPSSSPSSLLVPPSLPLPPPLPISASLKPQQPSQRNTPTHPQCVIGAGSTEPWRASLPASFGEISSSPPLLPETKRSPRHVGPVGLHQVSPPSPLSAPGSTATSPGIVTTQALPWSVVVVPSLPPGFCRSPSVSHSTLPARWAPPSYGRSPWGSSLLRAFALGFPCSGSAS